MLFIYFKRTLAPMAHNVPAVYDSLPARIKKYVAFLGIANCDREFAWEWNVAE
jgi:hypothetical protein